MHEEIFKWEEYQEVEGAGRQGRNKKELTHEKQTGKLGEPKPALHIYGKAAWHRGSTTYVKNRHV